MRKTAVGTLLITIAVLLLVTVVPHLRAPAPAVEATPSYAPISATLTVELKPRQELCVNAVPFSTNSRYAQFLVQGRPPARPELLVNASAPGYSAYGRTQTAARAAGQLTVQLQPPTSETTGGRICVRNVGRSSLGFLAIPPSAQSSISQTTVDGVVIDADVTLTLLSSLSEQRLQNLPNVVKHSSAFVPLPPWLIWLIGLLVVICVPAMLAFALARSIGERRGT
jgi:hypothetical protein